MKKILKSKIFWIIIVILIIVGAFVARNILKGEQVEYVTQEVKVTDIVQTVSATGQIKSASEIELNFENGGRLEVLNIKVGDEVKANDVLAQLRANDLAINVRKARADLTESIATLNKLKAGATTEDVAVYEAAVKQAETNLENTKTTYSQALVNTQEDILTDIDTTLTKANISLQDIYDVLNYKGDYNNFQTSNLDLYQRVDKGYDSTVVKVDEAELAYNLAKIDNSDQNINEAADLTLTALLSLSETLDNLSELFDYVIFTTNLTRTELDALKTTINTERTTTDSSINTVQGGVQDINDAIISYNTKVEEAQKALTKAQADLDFKKAPARPEDIALYEARVQKSQAALSLAQDQYDETIIRAPIDGVITDINFDIGEQTSLSQPVITMLAAKNYEIEVDIPESDIVKIGVGDEVEITLDAFSSEEIFSGLVTTINPAQTEIQDVVYYRVTVTFQDKQPENVESLMDKIKPGMTANVTVETAQVNSVLAIPLRAVKDKDGKKIVEILKPENQVEEIEVTTGLRGDEGLVEVKSGLREGQSVITFVRDSK